MAERTTDHHVKRFDPRFSPEFQPGFDPRVHREAPPALNREAAAQETPPSLITRVSRAGSGQSADAHGSASAPAGPARETSASTADGVAEASAEADEALDLEPATAWWRRLNPYLVVLGVLGVGILLSALALLQWVYETASNPYTQQFDYLLMQFTMFGAPVMVALGVAILALIPTVLALRYKR
ncbi:MAG: hypothetical protein KF680_11220 [Cryobacterium sp.]|nr:hypothetical protein [Cryobacterium sp.]